MNENQWAEDTWYVSILIFLDFFQKFLYMWMMYLYTALIHSQLSSRENWFWRNEKYLYGPTLHKVICADSDLGLWLVRCTDPSLQPHSWAEGCAHPWRQRFWADRSPGWWFTIFFLFSIYLILLQYPVQDCPRIGRNSQNPLLNAKHNK